MFKGVDDVWKKKRKPMTTEEGGLENETIALKKMLQNFALNFPRIIGHIRS